MDVSASGWHWRFTVSVPIQWQWNQCGGGCTSCLWWLKDFCHFSLFNFSALPFFLTFFSFWIWLKIFLVAISCLVIVCTLSVHSYNKLFSVVSWILCRKMFKSSHKSSNHMNFVLNFMAHYLLIFLIDNGTNWDSGMMHFLLGREVGMWVDCALSAPWMGIFVC